MSSANGFTGTVKFDERTERLDVEVFSKGAAFQWDSTGVGGLFPSHPMNNNMAPAG